MNEKRKIEENFSFDREKMANFLARMASEIANGKLIIRGEEIRIPNTFDMEYEFKGEHNKNELEIEITWKS
jgi:amphi-Trp domain-containing protein